jgi:hypothetical protein
MLGKLTDPCPTLKWLWGTGLIELATTWSWAATPATITFNERRAAGAQIADLVSQLGFECGFER